MPPSTAVRQPSILALLALSYFASASVAYDLAFHRLVVVWIPSGVILAALLLLETREWPAALAGALAGNVLADLAQGVDMPLAALGPAANTVEVLLAAWVVRRLAGPVILLGSLREVLVLILGAAILSNGVTTVLGALLLHAAWDIPLARAWLTWWIGDGLGMLIVTPALLAVVRMWRARQRLVPRQLLESAIVMTALALITWYVFAAPGVGVLAPGPTPGQYLVFPLLLWAALRGRTTAAAFATVLVATVVVWNTALGRGPLGGPGLTPIQQAVGAYLFLTAVVLTTLIPSAVVSERTRATIRLRESEERYRAAAAEVQALNVELERRVTDRTAALAANAAELEATNRELEAFSYSVAHDLRAPVRAINGFSRMLLEDQRERLGPSGVRQLEQVCASAARMGLLIDDLLELARTSRTAMRRETVDLTRHARAIAAELAASDPRRQVTFRIADGLACVGDERLLALALRNLLDNAWKFTASKERAVIEVGRTEVGEVFFVRDDGVGFDMAYAGDLFQPFHRLHGPGDFVGTGIGLALAQRIIQRHGGRVWAEGAVNRGATFYFTVSEE